MATLIDFDFSNNQQDYIVDKYNDWAYTNYLESGAFLDSEYNTPDISTMDMLEQIKLNCDISDAPQDIVEIMSII